jgi:hypothetical protein
MSETKSRDCQEPRLSNLALQLSPAYFALYATTSPAVTWGGFGIRGARCSATNSPATKVDYSSASLCSKTLVATVTPSPASTK